jgi:hypothetical protein
MPLASEASRSKFEAYAIDFSQCFAGTLVEACITGLFERIF